LDDTFDWGLCGSASDQLAVAILADLYDDKAKVLRNYENVKWTLLAAATRVGVKITSDQVRELVRP
jgi:S-adenosylmethionine/arginine decarboxylase-like enzyme